MSALVYPSVSTPIRVGVIGVGHMGQHHARLLHTLPNVQLAGVCDTQPNRGIDQAQRYGTRYFENYQALLPLVDAVCIAVPTTLHHEIGDTCLRSHRHVFIEKPIAATVPEAQSLIQTARENGCIIQVGHIERFNPAFLALKAHIGSASINRLQSERTHPALDRGNDVSVVIDLMIHDLDLMSTLAAAPVITIMAQGYCLASGQVGTAIATLRFANGIIGILTASKLTTSKRRQFKVQGPALDLEANFLNRDLQVKGWQNRDPQTLVSKYCVNDGIPDPLGAELAEFLTCIHDCKEPVVSGTQALTALSLATQIEEIITQSQSIQGIQVNQFDQIPLP